MHARWAMLLLLAVGCAPAAPANPPAAPANDPYALARIPPPAAHPVGEEQRPVLLKAARMFDGKGDKVLDGGVALLVENGRIARVGKAGAVASPAEAETIELGDATLLPGFIDSHTHLWGQSSGSYYKDDFLDRYRFPAEQAHHSASYARKMLEAGFTTVRDLGSHDMIDVGLRNAIREGLVPGPRMLVSVHPIGATGGHCDSGPVQPDREKSAAIHEGVCNGADACTQAVREQVKYGADVIKVCASGGVLSMHDSVDAPQLTLAELAAIVHESHRLGRKVAAHCHGDAAAKVAIEAGVDSIEHGSFLKPDTLALMKSKGVVLVPTLLALHWIVTQPGSLGNMPPSVQGKARQASAALGAMFQEALRQGVTIAFGTDSGVSDHGVNAHEFILMTGLGMSPAAALRAGTSVAAQLLGLADEVGTLEPGKLADVVAVPGDPLSDIRQVQHPALVMRAGRIFKR